MVAINILLLHRSRTYLKRDSFYINRYEDFEHEEWKYYGQIKHINLKDKERKSLTKVREHDNGERRENSKLSKGGPHIMINPRSEITYGDKENAISKFILSSEKTRTVRQLKPTKKLSKYRQRKQASSKFVKKTTNQLSTSSNSFDDNIRRTQIPNKSAIVTVISELSNVENVTGASTISDRTKIRKTVVSLSSESNDVFPSSTSDNISQVIPFHRTDFTKSKTYIPSRGELKKRVLPKTRFEIC